MVLTEGTAGVKGLWLESVWPSRAGRPVWLKWKEGLQDTMLPFIIHTCVFQQRTLPLLFFLPPLSSLRGKGGLTLAAPNSTLTPWHHQHPTNPAHKRKARKHPPFSERKSSGFQPELFLLRAQHLCLMPAQKKTFSQSVSYICPAIFASEGAGTPNRVSVSRRF